MVTKWNTHLWLKSEESDAESAFTESDSDDGSGSGSEEEDESEGEDWDELEKKAARVCFLLLFCELQTKSDYRPMPNVEPQKSRTMTGERRNDVDRGVALW